MPCAYLYRVVSLPSPLLPHVLLHCCNYISFLPIPFHLQKVCSTLRYTYARGLTQKIRTELEAAEPGSGEHALWQRMNGAVADVAVTQNAGNKRSLTEMQKSAGVNGARNLGVRPLLI